MLSANKGGNSGSEEVAESPEVVDVETGLSMTDDTISPAEVHEEKLPSSQATRKPFGSSPGVVASLIILLGAVAAAIIVGFGISAAQRDQEAHFERQAGDLLHNFELALHEYVTAASWLHQACRTREINHKEFRIIYEYLLSTGLEFQAVSFAMNVTSEAERESLENATRSYIQENHPDVNYEGFLGFDSTRTGSEQRLKQPFYFPIHFVEPIENEKNQAALDFDMSSSPIRWKAVDEALTTWQPALTERLKLIKESETGTDPAAYSVILMHPGIPLSSHPEIEPRDIGALAIRIPELLSRAHQNFTLDESVSVFIFDSTDSVEAPPFLGGAKLSTTADAEQSSTLTFSPERELAELQESGSKYIREKHLPIASREWSFVVVAENDTYRPESTFVILASVMLFVACLCLALWIYTNSRREVKMNELKSAAEAEKAAMMVENAAKAAEAERELNDFIAHEVRNPLSAAMSACSFVSSAVNESDPLTSAESRQSVREDVDIIDTSLHFINDLLRTMLDMHRAASNQLKIELSPTDILRDIFEPVATMLYKRGSAYLVLLECPEHLIVMTDRLRLKQTILNLGRNAAKFVHQGFIRFRAAVVDDHVQLYVEDSGPGVPMQKRKQLFSKFQESLDSLNQGTGIGLSLCKNLMELMNGEIWLDERYDSGVEGNPGTRFVISLNTPPLQDESDHTKPSDPLDISVNDQEEGTIPVYADYGMRELPENLSVLFVDDDLVLRKLFSRSIRRVAKGWQIQEAANGETALRLAESHKFDLIFLDQYMTSVEKQLLGTETARALRAKGVKSIICGLSANDIENAFLEVGADCFMFKPFPCENEALKEELLRILDHGSKVD